MFNWLSPVVHVLDRAARPLSIFFRDDDAGWSNDKLYLLLNEFTKAAMPIDVAIIPGALDQSLTDELLSRWHQNQHLIGLHQHGFSHTNHEAVGRKCEFGASRSKFEQKENIQKGQARLKEALGNALDPFFTPPWNRCTQTTIECLEELDFSLVSRNVTASPLDCTTLQQVPVHVDWSRIMKASPNPLCELGQIIAINLEQNEVTGIMLHHSDMEEVNLKPLAELLALFSQHNNVQGLLLRDTCVGWVYQPSLLHFLG